MKTFVLGFLTSFTILCPLADLKNKAGTKFEERQSINLYCYNECNGTLHTMCKYPVGGGDSCANEIHVFLTLEEKRYILDKLNHFRQSVASGSEGRGKRGKQPPASDMMKLIWDRELSMIAKRWSEQCIVPNQHDECRVTLDDMEVGQNVWHGVVGNFAFGSGQQIKSRKMTRIDNILSAWYVEVKKMDPKWVEEFDSSTENKVGNYTQMVWSRTTYVGCGYTEIEVSGEIVLRFVCNFKPKGNLSGRKVYTEGKPCSSCPTGMNCSTSLTGLCWNGENSNYVDLTSIGNIHCSNPLALFPQGFIVLSIYNALAWFGQCY